MKTQKVQHKVRIGSILMHLLFWALSLALFMVLIFLTRNFRLQAMDLQTALSIVVTLLFLAVSVYINLLILIPLFFETRRYLMFSLLEVFNIALFICLNYFVSMAFEGRHPNFLNEMVAEFFLVLVFLVITTLIKFTRDSISLQDANLRIKEIERENVESELRALKAQINPHFFFNTLNSIYSLSLDKSEKTPELILKLSELMRYILYETQDDYVSMHRQLDFLQNYIYMERLRTDEKIRIEMEISGEHTDLMVAPLLFIPFLENAFKHVAKEKDNPSYIRVSFNLTHPDKVMFSVRNTKYSSPGPSSGPNEGIGLANVRKRLNLLYPLKHELKISDTGDVFKVDLTVELV
ncbi:MAG: sensor histidine kinase [Bacteroidetes bacterium]|nr:sensor histidine kinase [Bacteroidota bacterium]